MGSPDNLLLAACEALVAMRRGQVVPALQHLGARGLTDNPRALAALLAEVEAELFRRFGPHTDGTPPRADDVPLPDRLRRASARRLLALGIARLERNDAPAAWPLLLHAAEKNPSLPEVFAYLGFAAHDLGRYELALDCLARVGSWSNILDAIHLHRGAALYKLARFTEALDALRAADAADAQGNFAAWTQLYTARTLVALGRTTEARPHLRKLIELEGDLAIARLRRARELLGLATPDSAPDGYEVIEDTRAVLVVKPAYIEAVRNRPPAQPTPAECPPPPPPAGRAPMQRFALPDGAALVRQCRRGGLLGHILGDKHLDGHRFLRELALSDALRRRGIPTPEVIAGTRREVLPGIYRAEIITREIPGALDLAAALRSLPAPPATQGRKDDLLAATAKLIRQLHDAGLFHPDLNARNILICPDGSAMIIDLDRAELHDELPFRARAANLARLYRSLHKLRLAPEPVTDADWLALLAAYAGDDDALRARTDALMSACRRQLRRHQLWWHLTSKDR